MAGRALNAPIAGSRATFGGKRGQRPMPKPVTETVWAASVAAGSQRIAMVSAKRLAFGSQSNCVSLCMQSCSTSYALTQRFQQRSSPQQSNANEAKERTTRASASATQTGGEPSASAEVKQPASALGANRKALANEPHASAAIASSNNAKHLAVA